MLYVFDLAGDIYSSAMAVVNYICFIALCCCVVIVYVSSAIGQFRGTYKGMAISGILGIIILLVIHFILLDSFGIPLLVPPTNTIYFTEFMHVIQYIASFAVIILGALVFITAALSKMDGSYGHVFMSVLMFLVVLIVIHYYVYDEFGVPIIFPPNMW